MAVLYKQATKTKYRITLELTVEDDFNPQQIDWRKVLQLHADEECNSYTEDLRDSVSDYY